MSRHLVGALLGLAALSACVDREPLAPIPETPPAAALAAGDPQALEVKFRSALDVRLRGDEVVSAAGVPLDALAALLDPAAGVRTAPLFTPEGLAVEARADQAAAQSGEAAPDLSSWYRVTVPAGTDTEQFLARLRTRPEVEHAYRAPVPAPPPGFVNLFATPDFTGQQGYLGVAPAGSEAVWARTLPGGDGAGVMVVDMEYDWNLGHEDLGLPASAQIGTGTRYTGFGNDHGTAVLGELAGRPNGFGVTGGVPGADIRVIPTDYYGAYNPAAAVAEAAAVMSAGDVLLLEAQYWGPTGVYVPLEVLQSVFDATRAATLAGRVVVAAAGNGGQNLDAPEMNGLFNRNLRDSGALIVGAGNSLHARLYFSCYGSRVDVQGWGGGVTTLGYGGLFGSSVNEFYTASFSGTSSASPIVAAAAAAVQGRRKARGLPVLTSVQMRTLLRATGSPQTGDLTQSIGTFPNLRAAFGETNAPGAPAGVTVALHSATSVRVGWSAGLDSITHFELGRRMQNAADSTWGTWGNAGSVNGAAREYDDTGLATGGNYQHRVRTCNDLACSDWTAAAALRIAVPAGPGTPVGRPLSGTQLRLTWVDNSANESGFVVERAQYLNGAWTAYQQIATPGRNTTVLADAGLTAGVSYRYRVAACNVVGCSPRSTSAAVPMPLPPAAPTGTGAAVVAPSLVRVTWTDASGNETAFEVLRRDRREDGTWSDYAVRAQLRSNAVVFADSGVAVGVYQYRVRACNGPVCSPLAPAVQVAMPAPPAAPVGPAVVALSSTSAQVTWTDASTSETGFTIQRRLRNLDGSWTAWAAAGTAAANATAFPDTGLLPDRAYEYRVAACAGVVCSPFTAAVRVRLPAS
ncbi:S8 family serine peptidase [Longimicrobium sp.]|uniref:S8 family serine peptidase n=1 Tax=Longimicrobium sp. TaxID=2029185 RepID=UPI003B3AA7D5